MKKPFRRYILEQVTMFDYRDQTKKEKSRTEKLIQIKKETGICPDEIWSLNYSIAVFIIPRLELFIKQTIGIPSPFKTLDEWKTVLRKMLYSMKKIASGEIPFSEKENPKFWKGLDLFHKYFLALWW